MDTKSSCATMPIWKWILEILLGTIIFIILYGIGQGLFVVSSRPLQIAGFIAESAVILGLFIGWLRLFEKKAPWNLFTIRPLQNLAFGLIVGLVFFIVIAIALSISGCYSPGYASPSWTIILVCFINYLYVACGEEAIFRGIIFRCIDERFGIWWALAISSLLFGLVHITQPNATLWSSIAIAIEAGLLLGAAYKYSGSLWLPIGIHWAWNFAQGNVFGFPVSGGSKEESIFASAVEGSDWLTGGFFGPEASVITVVLGLGFSIWFIWLYLKSNSR